jgi:DNA-binding MarR family transcriptional regulator
LLDYRAEEGKFNLSNKEMIEVLNMNDRTLYRALKSLESKGLIRRETVSVGNFGKSRTIIVL